MGDVLEIIYRHAIIRFNIMLLQLMDIQKSIMVLSEHVWAKKQKEGLKRPGVLKTGRPMWYTCMGSRWSGERRFRYRPPRPMRAVDGVLLVGDQNGSGGVLKTGRSMRYTCRESRGPRKRRFRYRPPRPIRAVDGLLLEGGRNGGGCF